MTTIEERVEHGADYLDNLLGPDWPDMIDLDTLNQENGCKCILAQINIPSGPYEVTRLTLDLEEEDAEEMGFLNEDMIRGDEFVDEDADEYEEDALTNAWIEFIQARRTAI